MRIVAWNNGKKVIREATQEEIVALKQDPASKLANSIEQAIKEGVKAFEEEHRNGIENVVRTALEVAQTEEQLVELLEDLKTSKKPKP